MKKNVLLGLRLFSVIACAMVAIVLMFAEPNEGLTLTQFMIVLLAMKVGAVLAAIVMIALLGIPKQSNQINQELEAA